MTSFAKAVLITTPLGSAGGIVAIGMRNPNSPRRTGRARSDLRRRVKSVLAGSIILTCANFQSPAATLTMPQSPRPGQAQSVRAANFDYENFANSGIDGAIAGRALANLNQSGDLVLRGASDAGLYHRISPAVVMVITKEGLGSGSVISAEGEVLTCYHVVEGYSRVGIIFKPAGEGQTPDVNSMVVADVVKTDQVADLALLKLEGSSKSPGASISLGDFNKINVGDDVHAIGHPTGETWTYTKGYVSQIRRGYQWQAEDGLKHTADVVQTQTPINPGNSGGPLLNSAGLLIGVNAFKDAGEGLNFAIGSDEIHNFIARNGNRKAQLASPAATECKPHILFEGRTADNDASIKQVDTQCHGKIDFTYVEPDAQDKPIYVVVTVSETGKIEGVIYSLHRDGKWNISYWDSKGSGQWDTIGYHPNGDITPSSFGPYVNN